MARREYALHGASGAYLGTEGIQIVYSRCVSGSYIVDGNLTVIPVDTVALAGTRVILRCTTDQGESPGKIAWYRHFDGIGRATGIVKYGCQPDPHYYREYSVISTSAGQCDLVINAVSLESAGKYRCWEGGHASVTLTVIGELSCNKQRFVIMLLLLMMMMMGVLVTVHLS